MDGNCKDPAMVILKFDYLGISSRQVASTKSLHGGKHYKALAEPPEGYVTHTAVCVWDHIGKDFPNVKTNYIQELDIVLSFK